MAARAKNYFFPMSVNPVNFATQTRWFCDFWSAGTFDDGNCVVSTRSYALRQMMRQKKVSAHTVRSVVDNYAEFQKSHLFYSILFSSDFENTLMRKIPPIIDWNQKSAGHNVIDVEMQKTVGRVVKSHQSSVQSLMEKDTSRRDLKASCEDFTSETVWLLKARSYFPHLTPHPRSQLVVVFPRFLIEKSPCARLQHTILQQSSLQCGETHETLEIKLL